VLALLLELMLSGAVRGLLKSVQQQEVSMFSYVKNPTRRMIIFFLRGEIPLGPEVRLIHTAKDSGMQWQVFPCDQARSYDVIATELDTKRLSADVTHGTKNCKLQGQLMTF
jgi:hypothetical protein